MERPEPQQMLGLRVMAKKGLDAYLTAGFLHFSITFDGKKLHFSMINVKTTLLKLAMTGGQVPCHGGTSTLDTLNQTAA